MGELRRFPVKPRTLRDERVIEPEMLNPGLFMLTFNNRKKQVRGLQSHTCQGSLYNSGHAHIDTDVLPNNTFHSIQEMVDCLSEFGDCTIIDGETV